MHRPPLQQDLETLEEPCLLPLVSVQKFCGQKLSKMQREIQGGQRISMRISSMRIDLEVLNSVDFTIQQVQVIVNVCECEREVEG